MSHCCYDCEAGDICEYPCEFSAPGCEKTCPGPVCPGHLARLNLSRYDVDDAA